MSNIKKEFLKHTIIGFLIALFMLSSLYYFITRIVIKEKIQQARVEAKTIIYYRHYLSLIAPKVKILDNNLSPFAATPAYATNQVLEMLRKDGFYIKQVSDKYRDPLDKPNINELKAIDYFKKHKKINEFYAIHSSDKYFHIKHIFYARKLVIEKSCLKCHGVPYKDVPPKIYKEIVKNYGDKAFNYHLGDVRGIISIVIPYQNVLVEVNKIFLFIVGMGFLFFLIGLFIFYKLNERINHDLFTILKKFRFSNKGSIPYIKEKMYFVEFEKLKDQINKTISMLKSYKKEIFKKYYFHPLTNLPNRNRFLDLAKNKKCSIVLLNIDKFKDINFYFGNKIGDKLIIEVAERLKNLSKKYKFKLFHIDIDEFALLFNTSNREYLETLLKEEILPELEKAYNIDNNEIIVRFRVGVSCVYKEYLRADVALDMAKELKKDIVFGIDVLDLNKYKEHLNWLKKLKWALDNDRIVPFYQPIVDKNKQIIKYEALVRLIDEDGKVYSPFFFLEIAKKSRLYLEITKRMIEKVILKMKEKNISASINLTLEDIEDENMRKFILEKLDNLENKKALTFEIVENEDVRENKLVKDFLQLIKNKGALLYIDDFGSGYANFDYLIKLSPDGIKIDGSLIKNILNDKSSEVIVKTIVAFAKEMNIKTIGEFVENEEIFNKLIFLGVDYFQGYYFSAPKEDI